MAARRPRVRPRFEHSTHLGASELAGRVKKELVKSAEIDGLVLDRRIELTPNADTQHFFSPQLTIDVEDTDAGATLRGRFGPHPHVWTMYVAIHGFGAFITLAAGIFGLSQHLSGQTPWALWALPASPLLAALVWALAFVGQNLGGEQMFMLRRFVEEIAAED